MTTVTVQSMASHATATIAGLTDPQARSFIRVNNIRSMGKLNTMLETLKGKSAEELTALTAADTQAASATAGSPAKKAASKANASAKAGKTEPKFAKKGREKRATVVEAGPRGFRFGEKWNNSVIAGEGLAMNEIHRPKLIAQATELGVAQSVIDSNDPAKICKSIAHKLEKQAAEAAATE